MQQGAGQQGMHPTAEIPSYWASLIVGVKMLLLAVSVKDG